MPSKKKKYNARFPAGRIKKIMQTDEEVGKVAQAVPVIISRTLELFVESLLKKSMEITQARNAKTLTPSHMKQCILSENRFDFLKDLVKDIPDASAQEDNENNALFEEQATNKIDASNKLDESVSESVQSTSSTRTSSTASATQSQYGGHRVEPPAPAKLNFSVNSLISDIDCPVPAKRPAINISAVTADVKQVENDMMMPPPPPLIPISRNNYVEQDTLCIDEDYDN